MKRMILVVALAMASTSASAQCRWNQSWCGGSAPTTYQKMRAASNAMQARINAKVLVKVAGARSWAKVQNALTYARTGTRQPD